MIQKIDFDNTIRDIDQIKESYFNVIKRSYRQKERTLSIEDQRDVLILLVPMSDIKPVKTKRVFHSVSKSPTTIILPGISKSVLPSDPKPNRSSYLETIANMATSIEYEDKDAPFLNKQQLKLKNILKKINVDTMNMIDSIRPRKAIPKTSREQLSNLAEREIDNSKKMIGNLQYDISKLQEKYAKFVDSHEEEELVKKIKSIKSQIEDIRNTNLEINLSIHRDGNDILKEYNDQMKDKMNQLESEKVIAEARMDKLRADSAKVVEEIKKTEVKVKEIQPKLQELEKEWQEKRIQQQEEQNMKTKELTLQEKKVQHESIKKKIDFLASHSQYRYYKLLRDLDYGRAGCVAIDNKIQQLGGRISKTKLEMDRLERQYTEIRRKKKEKDQMVLEYLKERKRTQGLGDSNIVLNFPDASRIQASEEERKRQWSEGLDEKISDNMNIVEKIEKLMNQDSQEENSKAEPLSPRKTQQEKPPSPKEENYHSTRSREPIKIEQSKKDINNPQKTNVQGNLENSDARKMASKS